MARPYVYERQSEYWVSRQIEEFLFDAGFEILTFPLSAYNERLVPADFVFFDKGSSKLFGFQYKTLYQNGEDFWPIDSRQHLKLMDYPWIYYCLSEMKRVQDHRTALHLVRIILPSELRFEERIYATGDRRIRKYSRWGAFFQGLQRCHNGLLIQSETDLVNALKTHDNEDLPWELNKLMVDLFIADFWSRHAVHLSPLLREQDDYSWDQSSAIDRHLFISRLEHSRKTGSLPDFSGVSLREVDLSELNLSGVRMADADLRYADLRSCDLSGANLERANLHGTVVTGARYDRFTVWPEGFSPNEAGAIYTEKG